ncbi:LSM domain-containing protein [Neobacillus vireti]|uniref:LSM domain-containing protein n=1 Tax=Neobacillus vireti TaxID=220686 RepID=UPI003B58A961
MRTNERDHINDFHKKCKQHLYQIVQVELNDGSVYQGILHSYDRDQNVYPYAEDGAFSYASAYNGRK